MGLPLYISVHISFNEILELMNSIQFSYFATCMVILQNAHSDSSFHSTIVHRMTGIQLFRKKANYIWL